MERVTSRANSLIAGIRKLCSDAAWRRERGSFVCDGRKLLEEALRWGHVSAVVCAEGTALPELPEGVRAVETTADILKSISPAKTPQGVVCVCDIPVPALPERLDGRRYIVLDGVQDPGNVGTILRTADAFRADGAFLLPGCADLYHPRTVRATMGAVFRLPVWQCDGEALRVLLRASRLPLYGAAAREDAVDIRETDFTRFAVAVGSEGRGLSPGVASLCGGMVRIPMSERCESLNAAAAAAVILWEAARREAF